MAIGESRLLPRMKSSIASSFFSSSWRLRLIELPDAELRDGSRVRGFIGVETMRSLGENDLGPSRLGARRS